MLKIVLFFVAVVVGACAQQIAQQKLKVLVLYESLCPDSIRFMHEQLRPSYEELKEYIDIQLVPFGKSQSYDNGAQFFCQHGPSECEGNRKQSCVLAQTADQPTQVEFACCQMTVPDKSSVKYCSQSVYLSGDIGDCMSTEKGTYLQLQAERITQKYAPTFVPTIVYDNVFNQRLQDSSIRNFRGTVCSLLQKRGVVTFNSVACQ